MPSIDLSRSAHQPAKRYTALRWQQGRVFTDDDLNESEAITAHERAESLIDVIGPSGTSDDAYLITGVADDGTGHVDFALGSGTIYVGGRRLVVSDGQRYLLQDDWFAPTPVTVPAAERHDLVWCEVQEIPITAVEDAELIEVGLGGPDTSARTRLVARVLVEPDVDADCAAAWLATVGADVDDRGVLQTDARMAVSFVPGTEPDDLCTPEVAGGYLTHLNQAIRVQCIDDSHFTWGFDNASSVYRVELGADATTVTFLTSPPDEAHRPRAGQVVELLPWSAMLSNGQLQAGAVGELAVVDQAFDPDTDQIVLAAAVGDFGQDDWQLRPDAAQIGAGGTYVYLRVWDRGDDTSAPAVAFTAGGAAVPLGTTGLEVTFTGTTFRPGDHWIIAARPAEPNQVVPWDFVTGRAPHGPVRLRAPLGIIHWDGGVPTVKDCRRRFRSLTELRGCCEYTVGDGSHTFGDFTSIQEAIDALPPEGGRICVRAGLYEQRFEIHDRTFVEISGCGHDTVIAPADGTGPVASIEGSSRVVLRSMSLVGLDDEAVEIGGQRSCADVSLEALAVSAGPRAAVVYVGSPEFPKLMTSGVTLANCIVGARSLEHPPDQGEVVELWPAVYVQAIDVEIVDCTVTAEESRLTGALGGIQVAGLCRQVAIRRTTVAGGSGNGVTVGSLVWVPADQLGLAVSDPVAFTGVALVYAWFVWFDGGCIHVGGEPTPGDEGTDEPPLVPLSAGPVRDLVVEDCTIGGMAGDGIGVVRFFDPTEDELADVVSLRSARIDRNLVVGNRRTPRSGVGPRLARMSGQGGIALGEVIDLRLRDNRILRNGASAQDPMCGVFVLHGEALLISGNDVVDNGAIPERDSTTRIGSRGGIVIRHCRGMSVGKTFGLEAPELAALVVSGNRVAHPAGQALWVMGVGQMLVHDNQLSAGSLAINDLLSGVLGLVQSHRDDLGQVALIALLHLVGLSVTIGNSGIPVDVMNTRPEGGDQKSEGLAALIGLTTALSSSRGNEAHRTAVEEETAVAEPVASVDSTRPARGAVARVLQGGQVSFNDNQVTLDLVDEGVGIGLCSVLLATLDDLSVQANQFRCLTSQDLVLADVAAVALWTVRCQGNRMQEVRMGQGKNGMFGTLLSGVVWGSMNITTGNQTSGPLLTAALDPTLLVDDHNLSWV